MALHTLGTTAATSLNCTPAWSAVMSDADIAAIGNSIVGDNRFAARLGSGVLGASGILATGSTHTSTTLDTLVATGGGPLSGIAPGMLVLAADIPPGTFVARVASATSVILSQAATGSNAAENVAFVPASVPHLIRASGMLAIPGRGIIKVLPGDVVAIDNTGWPILVSAAAISWAGSLWTFT